MIYLSLGRSVVKALFLFPRHNIKERGYQLLQGAYYKMSLERIMDFAWKLGLLCLA